MNSPARHGAARRRLALASALAAAAVVFGQTATDEQHWQRIAALRTRLADSSAARGDFGAALAMREELQRLAQSYLSLYPGGARTAAVTRIELEALFEIGVLHGGDWGALRARLAAHRNAPPAAECADDIDWWTALLLALDSRPPVDEGAPTTTRPATAVAGNTEISPVARLAPGPTSGPAAGEISSAVRDFVYLNPQSRHAPAILRRLFADAERSGDRDEMQRIVELAVRRGADDNSAALLAGRLARVNGVGLPFELAFGLGSQERFSTTAWIGKPVVILVWDSRNESSLRLMREIEALRRGTPDLEAAGVNLDADPREMQTAARAAEVSWPQFNDGHGRANAFARAWGVERSPVVFVIDRQGRLVGATSSGVWKSWLAERP